MGIEEGTCWEEHWVLYGNQFDNKFHIKKINVVSVKDPGFKAATQGGAGIACQTMESSPSIGNMNKSEVFRGKMKTPAEEMSEPNRYYY